MNINLIQLVLLGSENLKIFVDKSSNLLGPFLFNEVAPFRQIRIKNHEVNVDLSQKMGMRTGRKY